MVAGRNVPRTTWVWWELRGENQGGAYAYLTGVMAVALVACVANVGVAFAVPPDKTTLDADINSKQPWGDPHEQRSVHGGDLAVQV